MKNFINSLFVMILSSASLYAQVNVTFQVDMSLQTGFTTPEVNGTFNSWCGNCNAMSDANGDNIWEVTVSLAAGTYEYKYSHDAWAGQESLSSSASCVVGGGNTNRHVTLVNDTILPVICYGSCIDCSSTPTHKNITFQLDMSQQTGFTTPEVNGTFNGWCGNCNAMSDANSDNIWEVTVALNPGTYEYKYSHDAWAGQEVLSSSASCVVGGGNTNRSFNLVNDTILPVVCYASCTTCASTPAPVNVTFQLDMSQQTGFTIPEVNGTFNGWCGNCNAMSDSNGDNIWEVTLTLNPGTYEYKYSHDNWAGQESLTAGAPCTPGNTNRALNLVNDIILPVVCYSSCSACVTSSTDLIITTEVCSTANSVRMTGPWWSWNPTGGPIATDNGDGTWTFTISPAPTADMEYLLVVDGVQENLIAEMVAGGTCAPITDYSTYANRRWQTTDALTVSNTYGQCTACTPASNDLIITTEVCSTATSVRMTGPWWSWNPTGGPIATDNGDGTWTFTISPAPTADMEYLLVVDGVQENLIAEMVAGGTCAPVTDYSTYANRRWQTTDALTVYNTYGQCTACSPVSTGLLITVDVCSTTAAEVRMTGPWWSWDPAGGPTATDNGDGTWTFNLDPAPTANMEYLIVVDGVQENLIADMQNGGTCAPKTNYDTYANREWIVGSGDVNISYDRCVPCSYPDLEVIVEVCSPATQVNLSGAMWLWNPAFGPQGVDNGDGTWTITLSPVPNDTLDYLIVKDGIMENLVADMQNGAGCAPITDFSSYANRRWLLGQSNIAITYDQCGPCLSGLSELESNEVSTYPNPTEAIVTVSSYSKISTIIVYSVVGEVVAKYTNLSKSIADVDLTNLKAGVYTFDIQTAKGSEKVRIVKK